MATAKEELKRLLEQQPGLHRSQQQDQGNHVMSVLSPHEEDQAEENQAQDEHLVEGQEAVPPRESAMKALRRRLVPADLPPGGQAR